MYCFHCVANFAGHPLRLPTEGASSLIGSFLSPPGDGHTAALNGGFQRAGMTAEGRGAVGSQAASAHPAVQPNPVNRQTQKRDIAASGL